MTLRRGTRLAFGLTAGELDADPGALRLGVVRGDDGGVFPRGHPQTLAGGPAGASGQRQSADR